MPEFWTRPQQVTAQQWKVGTPPIAGGKPVGCVYCGYGYAQPGFLNSCLAPGQHDPVNHPHHLELETTRGTEVVFDNSWIVTFPDGAREVCAAKAFAERFTAVPLLELLASLRETLTRIATLRGITDRYRAQEVARKTLEQWEGKGAV